MQLLYERYSHLVFGVCLFYLRDVTQAKEVMQQIFITLLSDLVRFEVSAFKPWLLQVCRNHCMIRTRKNNRESAALPSLDQFPDDREVPSGISPELIASSLAQAVRQLTPEQQQCIHLFYEQRLPYTGIAASTGLSGSQIKQHIQQGRINLRQSIHQLSKSNPS